MSKDKKRAQRATSNVFAMFEQSQIQEFKEAFTMMDQNKDGFVDKDDLKDTFASFGKTPSDKEIDEMLNEAAGPINFTMFITLFGDKVAGVDPEATITSAFKLFDKQGTGKIQEQQLRDLLTGVGDKLTADEIQQAFKGAPSTKGELDYVAFAKLMTRGPDDGTEGGKK
jgi:Ca2+-binding EF-hand superfamily protein